VRTAAQLPRGRHGLSREEVHASQRGRMLVAMAAAVADKGYVHTTVADVLGGAGVSRETFYEHFRDKETCFLAAFDAASELLAAGLAHAVGEAGDPDDPDDRFARLEAALGTYLDLMAQQRALARTFLIDVYGAGPEALARRVEVMDRFVDLVAGIVGAEGEDRFACEAIVASISSMVTMRVASGEQASLPALREPIMGLARRLLEQDAPS
jgi:AcrR family transcriptional regulator